MTGGLGVRMPEPISNDEMNLGVMLLYIAYKYPEVVTEKQEIHCSALKFPGNIASRISLALPDDNMYTIMGHDFTRIVKKLMKAELMCRLTSKRGKIYKKTAPFLPVILKEDTHDPVVVFTAPPQCYFEEEEQDGVKVRQMKPRGEMLEFMREHMREK